MAIDPRPPERRGVRTYACNGSLYRIAPQPIIDREYPSEVAIDGVGGRGNELRVDGRKLVSAVRKRSDLGGADLKEESR